MDQRDSPVVTVTRAGDGSPARDPTMRSGISSPSPWPASSAVAGDVNPAVRTTPPPARAMRWARRGHIRAVTARMCPRLAHRIALAGGGVVLTAGLTSPATADEAGQGDGLEMPDRIVGSRAGEPSPARVTVTTGESLWSIAKAALPDQAGNAEITV